jgi:tetratricopeptide (TPR) repeat protein
MNKGLMLRQLGRPEEALAALEQALRLDPNLAKQITKWLPNS